MDFVVGVALGVILTVIGAVLVVRLQRDRHRLGYAVTRSGVVIRHPGEVAGNLAVTVPQTLLGDGIEDLDAVSEATAMVAVDDVCGFTIMLKNTGNTTLDAVDVRVSLDPNAKIVSAWIDESPDFGDRDISLKRDSCRPNVLHVEPPYLNESDQFLVRLLSVENDDLSCDVRVSAPGLTAHRIRSSMPRLVYAFVSGAILLLMLGISAFLTGVALYGLDGEPGTSAIFRESAGGKFIIVSTLAAPVLAVVFMSVATVLAMLLFSRRMRGDSS